MTCLTRLSLRACFVAPSLLALACFVGGDDASADEAADTGTGTDTSADDTTTTTETGSSEDTTETDTGEPDPCGNGVIDPGEECDGDNFAGNSCLNQGYDAGSIACDPMTCQLDLTGCEFVCPLEPECDSLKPNVAVILDYSTSMNIAWEDDVTRWESLVDVLTLAMGNNTWLHNNALVAVARFGHDPDPGTPGTTIPMETSGLLDGFVLDLPWFNPMTDEWYECTGAELAMNLEVQPAPMDGNEFGIGTWTKGALDRVQNMIINAVESHPEDMGGRYFVNLLITDGAWTSADGTAALAPASQDPAITAGQMLQNGVKTYVIVLGGDAQAEAAGDSIAAAGGTDVSYHVNTPAQLTQIVNAVVQQVQTDADPDCP
jgi:hypothetical protein